MPEPPAESVTWVREAAKVRRLALPVSLLVGLTAVSGAFVAGNDAVSLLNSFMPIIFVLEILIAPLMMLKDNHFASMLIARGMHLILFRRWVIHGYQKTFLK